MIRHKMRKVAKGEAEMGKRRGKNLLMIEEKKGMEKSPESGHWKPEVLLLEN